MNQTIRTWFQHGHTHQTLNFIMFRNRFAPSPTGALHLGNARTALLSWLHTREQNGQFILRLEDLDIGRVRTGSEQAILQDLNWLGLDWDEGPDVGGPFGPYRQSERKHLYQDMLARLPTYACTCTRKKVLETTQTINQDGPRYPGTCSHKSMLPTSQVFALRVKLPNQEICFHDMLCGMVCTNVWQETGDMVVQRNDKIFAYQFVCATDDAAMNMTHVTRGQDLLGSTSKQMSLAKMLGLKSPTYCHVPLMLDWQGKKISKSLQNFGAPSLNSLRQANVQPEEIVRDLAQSLGWNVRAACTPKDLIGFFDAWVNTINLEN